MSDALMTLDELAAFLDPPMPAGRLKLLVAALGIEPAGRRDTGGRRRST
jgi:hypothetical protein